MEERILTIGDLARQRRTDVLLGCEVESQGMIIGKVMGLRTDKYGRIDGLEVGQGEELSDTFIVPYDRIDGFIESRNAIKVRMPVG